MLDVLPCRLSFQEVRGGQASQGGQGCQEDPEKQTHRPQDPCDCNTESSQTSGLNKCAVVGFPLFLTLASIPHSRERETSSPAHSIPPLSSSIPQLVPLPNSGPFEPSPAVALPLPLCKQAQLGKKKAAFSPLLSNSRNNQRPNVATDVSPGSKMYATNHTDQNTL